MLLKKPKYVINRIKKCIKYLVYGDVGDVTTKLPVYPKDLTRQVLWNALNVYNDLVNAQKEMPTEWYSNEHGTITLMWERQNPSIKDKWYTLGEMEIGKTRWVAYYEYSKDNVKFGQGAVGEFNYDWLP